MRVERRLLAEHRNRWISVPWQEETHGPGEIRIEIGFPRGGDLRVILNRNDLAHLEELIVFPRDDEPEKPRSLFDLPDPTEIAPTLVRRDSPATTIDASHRSASSAATQRGYLLRLIHDAGEDGLTSFEAEDLMLKRFPRMRTVRPRVVELRDDGWIVTLDDRTRPTDSGGSARVHILNPDARADYARWRASQRDD